MRYIDWNVTARLDTPYVRQYVEDREITGWFLLDLSPSMDFGTLTSLKRTVLIDFVATLARLLTRHGNRVGAIFYGSRVEGTIPPRGGRLQVLRLVDDLLEQPRLPRAPFTDLAPLLEAGLRSIRRLNAFSKSAGGSCFLILRYACICPFVTSVSPMAKSGTSIL